jgi:hypothetical protein
VVTGLAVLECRVCRQNVPAQEMLQLTSQYRVCQVNKR